MANFVPEGEDNSKSVRPFGRRDQNFIPAEGQVEAPRLTSDEQWEQAKAVRAARRDGEKQMTWNQAVDRLRNWQPSQAVQAIQAMPPGLAQLYLLAEEYRANRSAILQFFPAAGPTARETWQPYAGGSAAPVRPDVEEPVSIPGA